MSGHSEAQYDKPSIVKGSLPSGMKEVGSMQHVHPDFSLQHEASMCCVALRFRHSPKVLLPHNLSLLNKALHSEYSHFQEHMSYLSQLMLDQGGKQHSNNRPFSKSEDESILELYYQTNQKDSYNTKKAAEETYTLPPPLPFAAVLHANGFLPHPMTSALFELSSKLKCKVENITTRYKQLETTLILNEVAHQEQHQHCEEADLFDAPVKLPANRPCTTDAVACIVRRARHFVSAICTDYNGNHPRRHDISSNSGKKRSYDAYTSNSSSGTNKIGGSSGKVDTALSCDQLERMFAGTVNSCIGDDSKNSKRRRTDDSDIKETAAEYDTYPYFAEDRDSESDISASSDTRETSSVVELSTSEDGGDE